MLPLLSAQKCILIVSFALEAVFTPLAILNVFLLSQPLSFLPSNLILNFICKHINSIDLMIKRCSYGFGDV